MCQSFLVEAPEIDRNSSKHSKSEKVIAVLETVKIKRVSYSISEKVGIRIEFDNLKAHFGLNLSAKDYSDHKGVDDSILYRCQK